MSWIKDFFKGGEAKTLKKDLEDLKTALTECNERLAEKQEHINKTNAYWKKKMRDVEGTKKNKSKE